jgi:NAD(P)-dependent dehydrogenase (short-subunit alcohol dehydrogenase family)
LDSDIVIFQESVIVSSTGFSFKSPVENMPDEKWDLQIAVMLSAPFHLTKRFLPAMKKKGQLTLVT